VENIMVDKSGHIKIVDFGLAMKIVDASEHMPAVGSLIYMAPEALRDQKGGRHTDWWAVGILAFELLTGCTPWSSLDDRRVIRHEILNTVVLPPRSFSNKAARFINSILRHDVDSRLGTSSVKDLQSAPFFDGIDWAATASQSTEPAFTIMQGSYIDDPRALDNYLARSPDVHSQALFELGVETVDVHPSVLAASCVVSKVVSIPPIIPRKADAVRSLPPARGRPASSAAKMGSSKRPTVSNI